MTVNPALLALWTASIALAPRALLGGTLTPTGAPGGAIGAPPVHAATAPAESSLLATVPEDAYALVHCRDVAALRARAERNDWYRLLGSPQGESLLNGLAQELRTRNHDELDELLGMAREMEGEAVFFDTGTVAAFVTETPASPAELVGLMRDWMPHGDAAARHTLEVAGGVVEVVAWPDEIDGRAGHFAAFVVHTSALAIYSGDDLEAVKAALTESVSGLGSDRRAPLVASYLESGGGEGGGIELFVDFTPLVDQAEAALKEAVKGMLPYPPRLLGLEAGTWLHASADVYPGTHVECRARLHLPPDTLVARLADTFEPLPPTLSADLPKGTWGLGALGWDLELFYQRVRAAYEEADRTRDLAVVDAGMELARNVAGVDPVEDVLNQFAGDFALYFVDPPGERVELGPGETEGLLSLGMHASLADGGAFLTALERLMEVGDLASVLELEEIAGVDAYVTDEDESFDGGLALLPHVLSVAPTRRVLERSIRALTRAEGASLLHGSLMQAAIEENAGSCFLSCVEMTPLRAFWLPDLEGDLRLPPLDGQTVRDPFDSQLIGAVRRTRDGFELRLHTR